MPIKKRHHKKIEDGFKFIFQTSAQKGKLNEEYGSLMTMVKEPLVKQQIILLGKLCEEVSASVTLKAKGNGVFIEFW